MRILLVGNDAGLGYDLASALRAASFTVDTAADGANGLRKAQASEYDAIVLDVLFSVFNSWELLRRLRQNIRTPVLLLTGRDTTADRVRGLDLGADDYVVKPFHLSELLARLRSVIRRTGGYAKSTIEIDGILVDTRSRAVTAKGRPVMLTPREYDILEYLAVHRGRVVTRAELNRTVLSEPDDTQSNLLDVHVSAIRRKLGAGLIATRRGLGYSIE